ncbi:SDR family NAD(P)-dependent oxidoreductase [Streptomyces sp. SID8358]|nr:SDR family NAD(P)-dependent oxidoreductase [Streptomyces sp. SID8358]
MSSRWAMSSAVKASTYLTARALARAWHTVYASMRGTGAEHARALRRPATDEGLDLRTVTLDVRSDASAEAAVATILAETDGIDVVVRNAGHLAIGVADAGPALAIRTMDIFPFLPDPFVPALIRPKRRVPGPVRVTR